MNAHGMLRIMTPLILMIATGCASTKISNVSKVVSPGDAPSMIYVGHFDLGQARLKSDPGTITGRPRLINFGRTDPVKKLAQLSHLLSKTVVSDLRNSGYPAEFVEDNAALPVSGWMVSGRFLEVNEGNRMQSAIVGFGMGGADAQLYVIVRDLARPPGQQDLISMDVDAKDGKMPGGGGAAVVTHTPYGMAAKFVLDRNASEKEIKRAGHEIAEQVKKFAGS